MCCSKHFLGITLDIDILFWYELYRSNKTPPIKATKKYLKVY